MPDLTFGGLVSKLRSIPGMKAVTEKAALLYAVFEDEDTPKWVKAAIVTALIYLINPADAVPDFIPSAGYSDDVAVLLAALGTIKAYIESHHHDRAKEILNRL